MSEQRNSEMHFPPCLRFAASAGRLISQIVHADSADFYINNVIRGICAFNPRDLRETFVAEY